MKNLIFKGECDFLIDTTLTVDELNKVVKRMKKLRNQNNSFAMDTKIIKDLIQRRPHLKDYFKDLAYDPYYRDLVHILRVNCNV